MSSVKNFQLCMAPGWHTKPHVSPTDRSSSQDQEDTRGPGDAADSSVDVSDDIILQFGKVADERFTMDVQYPLSIFQVLYIVGCLFHILCTAYIYHSCNSYYSIFYITV